MSDVRQRIRQRLGFTDDPASRQRRSDFDLNPHLPPRFELQDDETITTEGRSLRDAAVLVPLIDHSDEITVLLTRRADHLPTHAGQVSFPGGRVEEADTGPVSTALREAEEEVGLAARFVEIIGELDHYETGTGFSIHPIVGLIRPEFELLIDPGEVAEAFEVPLSFLMDPRNHERHSAVWEGRTRHYYAMPYNDHYIWGATAGMLVNLYRKLYA